MRGPYGFELNENCQSCKVRANGFFCQLGPAAVTDFNKIKSPATYPAGARSCFLKSRTPRGVFVLCADK